MRLNLTLTFFFSNFVSFMKCGDSNESSRLKENDKNKVNKKKKETRVDWWTVNWKIFEWSKLHIKKNKKKWDKYELLNLKQYNGSLAAQIHWSRTQFLLNLTIWYLISNIRQLSSRVSFTIQQKVVFQYNNYFYSHKNCDFKLGRTIIYL